MTKPHSQAPPSPRRNATRLYLGDKGEAYWERNGEKVRLLGPRRRESLKRVGIWGPHDGTSVLEVGAGRGDNLPNCGVGLEVDLRQLQHFLLGRVGVWGDACELPFAPSSFDTVFCVGLLMHFDAGQWPKVAREMQRVARSRIVWGEYEHVTEKPLVRKGWDGALWARDYMPGIPGDPFQSWVLKDRKWTLDGFDPDVVFFVWEPKVREPHKKDGI